MCWQVGLVKTGVVGFCCETLCLTLCVASVFAPGSPFDASAIIYGVRETRTLNTTASSASPASPLTPQYSFNASSVLNDSRSLVVDFNSTLEEQHTGQVESVGGQLAKEEEEQDFTFVILFMAGVIMSRFGE